MGIGFRIKEARERLGLTQTELGKLVGVTGSSITNYENNTSHPKEPVLYKLIKVLNVDANYLFQDEVPLKKVRLTLDEENHINDYRKLDDRGKTAIDTLIQLELNFCRNTTNNSEKIIPLYRYTHYNIPVSAGTGEPLDVSTAVMVDLEIEPPRGTSFILRISGNSMEPEYYDGDYIYVQKKKNIYNGDIGIFIYQGSVYMKEYTPDGLKSLNPAYPLIPGNEDIRCIGKVLGVVDGAVNIVG